ncbi:Yng1p NDAI_0F00540 [Naumovozyma dairenensis CBS 421]|uniref:Zinc finger PHD-type domain-containing protein n=1 Tax=Naumovozyma dairenensis (strain ATCC 10597 / BCRC 20456 / CBS 421 / NBRC 0211 / NRRL Y-12639) TaxID=1071378 RepID=G0WC62_NAUDC|nr:hypothetical protein NDAI_0F00540 [Naumovozyma dairenensis CBS 421]CCD25373.1 hypothetical protein NDAI_0F00540 [Naumovozyma dairenensis CBS 421]
MPLTRRTVKTTTDGSIAKISDAMDTIPTAPDNMDTSLGEETDLRYHFLNTLDHFPSKLIRSLWVIQSLDFKLKHMDQPENNALADTDADEYFDFLQDQILSKAAFTTSLIENQIESLKSYEKQLLLQKNIIIKNKRFSNQLPVDNVMKSTRSKIITTPTIITKPKKKTTFKIKLTLKDTSNILKPVSPKIVAAPPPLLYCFCQRPSFGEMIACDNINCPNGEWFHYECVGIKPSSPPKGEWFCSEHCKLLVTMPKKDNNNKGKKKPVKRKSRKR